MTRTALTPIPRRLWWLGLTLSIGPAMSLLDTTMVNVALPRISAAFGVPLNLAQWVVTGYLLAMVVALSATAWLTNRIGGGRLYRLSCALFVAASTGAAFAPDIGTLIALRVAQGLAAGLLVPLSQLLIAQAAGPLMARVVGAVAAPVFLAPLLGPSVGGLLVEYATWRAVFLVSIPFGAVAFLLSVLHLPRGERNARTPPFDGIGFLLAGAGLVATLIALGNIASAGAPGLRDAAVAGFGIACVVAFLLRCRAMPERALIDVSLFRRGVFARCAAIMFFAAAATLSLQMLMPLHLMLAKGLSPSEAGLLLAPIGIGSLLATPWIGRFGDRFGLPAVVWSSAALGLLAILILAVLPLDWSPWARVLPLAALGACLGCMSIPTFSMAYGSLPAPARTRAMPTLNIVQRLGGPVATTLAAILASHLLVPGVDLARASLIFALPALALAVVLLLALDMPPIPRVDNSRGGP